MSKQIANKIQAAGIFLSLTAVVLSPAIASAAVDTENTTVSATVSGAITVTTSGTVSFTLVPTPSGVVSSNSDTVTVSTNNATGYNLKLEDADATVNLNDGGSNNFTAHTGTQASPTALTNGTWGYAVASVGGFDGSYSALSSQTSSSKFAGVPASGAGNTIKTTVSPGTNDATTVWYAAMANTAQAPGTYTDSVTYTATTN